MSTVFVVFFADKYSRSTAAAIDLIQLKSAD